MIVVVERKGCSPIYTEHGSEWIRKHYSLEILDASIVNPRQRLNAIATLGSRLNPAVFVELSDTEVVVSQRRVIEFCRLGDAKHHNTVFALAHEVQKLHSWGLVHGDLSYSNVAVGPDREILIFDWEPVLAYRTDSGSIFRTSKYAFHPEDLEGGFIGVKSDLAAFAGLAFMHRHGQIEGIRKLKTRLPEVLELASQKLSPYEVLSFLSLA